MVPRPEIIIHIDNDMNMNIHIDSNMNIDVHIIINMNIKDYEGIIYFLLGVPYWVFPYHTTPKSGEQQLGATWSYTPDSMRAGQPLKA